MSVSASPLPAQSFPCHACLALSLCEPGNGWMVLNKAQLSEGGLPRLMEQSGAQTCPAGLWANHLIFLHPLSQALWHQGQERGLDWGNTQQMCAGIPGSDTKFAGFNSSSTLQLCFIHKKNFCLILILNALLVHLETHLKALHHGRDAAPGCFGVFSPPQSRDWGSHIHNMKMFPALKWLSVFSSEKMKL